MAISRSKKEDQVAQLTSKLSDSASIVFTNYIGLTVGEAGDLRQKLKEAGSEMKVAKKTLIKIAAKEAGLPELTDDLLNGPIACVFNYTDPIAGAQVLRSFGKDHEQVSIVGAVFDGTILGQDQAVELSKLPSRDVLTATFMGMLQSPLRSFMSMSNSPLSGLARGLSQLAEKGGLGEAAPEPKSEEVKEEPKVEEVVEEAEVKTSDTPATEENTEAPVETTDDANKTPESDTSAESAPAETAEADTPPEATEA
jgi:large subunit ribosomal protein L10